MGGVHRGRHREGQRAGGNVSRRSLTEGDSHARHIPAHLSPDRPAVSGLSPFTFCVEVEQLSGSSAQPVGGPRWPGANLPFSHGSVVICPIFCPRVLGLPSLRNEMDPKIFSSKKKNALETHFGVRNDGRGGSVFSDEGSSKMCTEPTTLRHQRTPGRGYAPPPSPPSTKTIRTLTSLKPVA